LRRKAAYLACLDEAENLLLIHLKGMPSRDALKEDQRVGFAVNPPHKILKRVDFQHSDFDNSSLHIDSETA
jgi:hypothetical protein